MVAIIAGTNFDHAMNPHPHPTDFAHKMPVCRIQILADSIASLILCTVAVLLPLLYIYIAFISRTVSVKVVVFEQMCGVVS